MGAITILESDTKPFFKVCNTKEILAYAGVPI